MDKPNNSTPIRTSSSVDKSYDGRWSRLRRYIRNHGHSVHTGILYGAGTQLGSGAVSLIILWIQTRR